ncbi:hypothetical protein [Conexibacter sp. S30A1]|uniref:hypothetical protein n=1 Tax=Conexibacter sp. S30A1 TaxID=2937800 RepID=UPI00200F6A29|nr:hypothetical protein [Conexibacter sp. S30A1]
MASDDDPAQQPEGDELDYRQAPAKMAARKGFGLHLGGRDDSRLRLHIEDRETGKLIFGSPSFAHAYGHLQQFPDRPPSA